jgi:hypothetical protein
MQVDPAALPLDLINLALAVVLKTGLEGQQREAGSQAGLGTATSFLGAGRACLLGHGALLVDNGQACRLASWRR